MSHLRCCAAFLVTVSLQLLGLPAQAAPNISVEASTRQGDGKILVAGQNPTTSPRSVTLGRMNADGTMDLTFGTEGWVQFGPTPDVSEFRVTAIVSQDDGRFVVAAVRDGLVSLMRFESSGALDTTFGTGMVVDAQSSGLLVNSLLPGPGGSLWGIGGYSGASTGGPRLAAVVRYTSSGARDATFGTDGISVLSAPGEHEYRAAVATGGGGFAAVGSLYGGGIMLAARYGASGDLDPAFNGNGWITGYAGNSNDMYGAALDAAGNLIATGRDASQWSYTSNFLAYRISPSGYILESVVRPIPIQSVPVHATSVSAVTLADGDVLLAGTAIDSLMGQGQFALTRLTSGAIRVGPPAEYNWIDDVLRAVFANGSGQIIAVGTRESGPGYGFMQRTRYFADTLELDTDFPTEGDDWNPNAFTIAPVLGALMSEVRTSAPTRISGINVPVPIYVDGGGSFSIGCTENYTTFDQVQNGQWVCVRLTSAATAGTTVSAQLTVGSQSASFQVTTGGPPNTTITMGPPNPSGSSASFWYAGDTVSGPITGYECRIDNGPWENCSPPYEGYPPHFSYGVLPGPHTFEVRAGNAYGFDLTPAIYTWTVISPPETTITSAPPVFSNQTTATFAFEGTNPPVTFECRPGIGNFEPCTSPVTYTGLTQATRTFEVRARNAAGTDWSPATHTWTIDTTPPDTDIFVSPASPTTLTTGNFQYNSPDTTASFQCSLDEGAWYACGSGGASSTSVTVSVGTHTLRVRAVDQAGNVDASPDSKTWVVNSPAPLETMITSGPSGTVTTRTATFTYTGSGPGAGTLFDCSYNGGAFYACNGGGTSFHNLVNGTYNLQVRARDASGNVDATPEGRNWTVDAPAPDTVIDSGPSGTVSSTFASFTFSSDQGFAASFECSLDGMSYQPCAAQYMGLTPGVHTLLVRARVGYQVDETPAGRTWTIDPEVPETTLLTTPPAYAASSSAAIFTFSSNEGAATFECALDGAAWVACASPRDYGPLAAGSHTFQVRAVDAASNLDPTPASYSWIVVATPETQINTGPSGTIGDDAATFTFSSPDAGVTFECSLDGSAFSTCTSPASVAGIADGMHMFEVRARNAAGTVDPTPATRSWSVDTTNPNTTIASGPDVVTVETSATFVFSANEGGVAFLCKLDGGAFAACTSPVTYTGLAGGPHGFVVYSTDAAGNPDASPATWNWVVDLAAPDTQLSGGPTGTVTQTSASFNFGSPESGVTFECRLDGAAFAACVSPKNLTGLADGSHTFEVRAKDAVGNADATPASRTWSVDTTAPQTTITAAPATVTNQTSATFTFTSSEGGSTFQCKLDGGSFSSCTSPRTYTGLSQTAHTFQVRATDALGNQDATPASHNWIVDTSAPSTTISSGPSGTVSSTSATFTFTSNQSGSTFECRMDSGSFAPCTSPKAYTGLSQGSHTFRVRAIDPAGNVDASPATRTWTIN